MRAALVVAGDLDSISGGYLYDRKLVSYLQDRGHAVEVVSLPAEPYPRQLLENARSLSGRLDEFDVVVEDGLAHPSLLRANRNLETPVVALVHMLRCQAVSRAGAVGGTGPVDGKESPGSSFVTAVENRLVTAIENGLVTTVENRLVTAVERRFLGGVDAAIHNSEATRREARRLGAPPRDVVAPPGGDRFDPDVGVDEIRRRARDGPIEICFLGSVVERKGLDLLVEALAGTSVDWRLCVIGDVTVEPDYVRRVRRRIAALGIDKAVTFEGRLPDAAVAERLRASSVLAVPSRYEPFGIAFLEGMSFGCVPIATSRGGASEFVADGTAGMIVPPEPASIADRLERLGDRDRLATMGIAARRAYVRQPTWDESLARIERFLSALVEGREADFDPEADFDRGETGPEPGAGTDTGGHP